MSKIDEMAEAYGRNNPFTWTDADCVLNEDINSPAIAFETGANYVLGEIEKYRREYIVCDSGLARIIEQLKK